MGKEVSGPVGRSEDVPGVMMLKLCLKDSLVREGSAVDWAAGFHDGGRRRGEQYLGHSVNLRLPPVGG